MPNAKALVAGIHRSNVERRFRSRYPLELNVDFRSLPGEVEFSGSGLAINVSSSGVLVKSQRAGSYYGIRVGELLEIGVEWPFLLDGKIPLRLIATGRIMRRGAYYFAATFERYEFRTKRSNLTERPPTK
jgi:hypothetical protein